MITTPVPVSVNPVAHRVNTYCPVIELNRSVSRVLSSWMQRLSDVTETVKLHIAVSPAELITLQVTTVIPAGNWCGEVITVGPIMQTGVSAPSQESVAVVVKLTVAVVCPGSVVAVIFPGQVIVGGVAL